MQNNCIGILGILLIRSIPVTTRKKKAVGLERGPLSFVSTTEELLDRKVVVPVYKTENTAVRIRHSDHVASQKLAITSPTSSGRSVGIVRSWTQIMGFFFFFSNICLLIITSIHYCGGLGAVPIIAEYFTNSLYYLDHLQITVHLVSHAKETA
jgi:hypothetical protein